MEEIGTFLDDDGIMLNEETFSSSYTYQTFDTEQDSMFAGLDFMDFASLSVDQNPEMINMVLSMPLSTPSLEDGDLLEITRQLPIENSAVAVPVPCIGAEIQLEELHPKGCSSRSRECSPISITQTTHNYSSLGKLLQSKTVSSTTKSRQQITSSTTPSKQRHRRHDEIDTRNCQPVDKTLRFPPCCICGGRASGLHYGVNSCEACKGFFRRYLTRNEEYKCTRAGSCPIVNRNRENCSGCRLRKCLELGMSKDKSKLGRYTLLRRTETIQKVNKYEGKTESDSLKEEREMTNTKSRNQKSTTSRKMSIDDEVFDKLVDSLVRAMDNIKPYGPNITTLADVTKTLKQHHERYKRKTEVYGEMKSIPRDEYYKLLKQYGIDVDGRLEALKDYVREAKRVVERYCNFAKLIPDFSVLPYKDQTNLLKASRCDFFLILMHEGYNHDYKILLTRSGKGYHAEEVSDKIFSRKLVYFVCNMYFRWQKLFLTKAEKALLIALTLVFTDRCNLENHDLVEKIQLSLADMLRRQLEKTCKKSARLRFTKIIDCLVLMRESSELYLKEYKQLCKDEYVMQEVPTMKDFLLDDW